MVIILGTNVVTTRCLVRLSTCAFVVCLLLMFPRMALGEDLPTSSSPNETQLLGLLSVLAPGDDIEPGEVLEKWKDFANSVNSSVINLPRSSLTAVCGARCMAHCRDVALDPAQLPYDEACHEKCLVFQDNSWMSYCHDNVSCLNSCIFILNVTGSTLPEQVKTPYVEQENVDPYTVLVVWEPVLSSTRNTVIYVVERRDEDDYVWRPINMTFNTNYTVTADICAKPDFRVAAVNQFGTDGFSQFITRQILPGPTKVQPLTYSMALEGDKVIYRLYFLKPREWVKEDIESYECYPPRMISCNMPLLPPIISHFSATDKPDEYGRYVFSMAVFYYGQYHNFCVYATDVFGKSRCDAPGDQQPVLVDFTDCSSIENMPCPTPMYTSPGQVRNVTVEYVSAEKVNVTWMPPIDQGTDGVSFYYIQYGLLHKTHPIFSITEEGSNTTDSIVSMGNSDIERLQERLNVMNVSVMFVAPQEPENYMGRDLTFIYILTPLIASALIAALVTGMVLYRRKLNKAKKKEKVYSIFNLSKPSMFPKQVKGCMVDNMVYWKTKPQHPLPPVDSWEISPSFLTLGEVLGQGAFGQVVKGGLNPAAYKLHPTVMSMVTSTTTYDQKHNLTVAVKMLIEYADGTHAGDFLKEIALMKRVGVHPHVVSMIGCITQMEPLCLIVEHMSHGDLLRFLRCHRQKLRTVTDSAVQDMGVDDMGVDEARLTLLDLLSFARQICLGMEFLSQKGFIHRDLATRNVLVGGHKIVKIGDFGLTRYIYEDHIYVTQKKGAKLPLKWMAVEAIFDFTFSPQSDVWSFGVVLFELITLGGTPYPLIANKELLRKLQSGFRMEKPDNCSREQYEMMLSCWKTDPKDRPTFTELRERLEQRIAEHSTVNYLDFDLDETKDYYCPQTSSSCSADNDDVFTDSPSHCLRRAGDRDSGVPPSSHSHLASTSSNDTLLMTSDPKTVTQPIHSICGTENWTPPPPGTSPTATKESNTSANSEDCLLPDYNVEFTGSKM